MSNSKKSKIVLATGIFYPDVGGPAIHVRKIAEALTQDGHGVVVLAYGDYSGTEQFSFKVVRISKKLPKFLRRLSYLLAVLKESVGASALYAFNLTTAGLPVFLAGKLFGKKILIRVAGDPIWERIVEKGKRFVSFVKYYEQGLQLVDKPLLFKLIKFTLPRFDKIVFYTPLLSEIYQEYYNVPADKIYLILNSVSRHQPLAIKTVSEPTILFAGRFVAYKNLELLIRAFDGVRQKLGKGRLVMIGEGPDREQLAKIINDLPSAAHIDIVPKVNQDKLFEYICSSWLGIGPALTEFNPNFILECLSFGKPVLLSRESGLSVKLPEEFLFDPQNEIEFEQKLADLLDPISYKKAVDIVGNLNLNQSWNGVVDAHRKIIYSL